MADSRAEPVSDDLSNRQRLHFDEAELAALILAIALINFFNLIDVAIQAPAGSTW